MFKADYSPVLASGIHCTLKSQGASLAHACASAVRELYLPKAFSLYWVNSKRGCPWLADYLKEPRAAVLTAGHTIGDLAAAILTQALIFLKLIRNTLEILSKSGLMEYDDELAACFVVVVLSHFLGQQKFHLSTLPTKTCWAWSWESWWGWSLQAVLLSCCFRGAGGWVIPPWTHSEWVVKAVSICVQVSSPGWNIHYSTARRNCGEGNPVFSVFRWELLLVWVRQVEYHDHDHARNRRSVCCCPSSPRILLLRMLSLLSSSSFQ